MEAHQAKLRFFKASTCQELLERLVGHFMVLSEEVGITSGEDWWWGVVGCWFQNKIECSGGVLALLETYRLDFGAVCDRGTLCVLEGLQVEDILPSEYG